MGTPEQEQFLLSSPESIPSSSVSLDIPPSSYLAVPIVRTPGSYLPLPGPNSFEQDFADELLLSEDRSTSEPIPHILAPAQESTPTASCISPASPPWPSSSLSDRVYMSVYSSSSVDTELSEFSNPPARRYRVANTQKMSRKISAVRLSSILIMFQELVLMNASPKRSNTSKLCEPTKSTLW
jgi:hypothetical protein